MTIPKTLKRHADKISDVYRQPDGSWDISLKSGWFCEDTETHGIIENTLGEVALKMASVVRCSCSDCAVMPNKV